MQCGEYELDEQIGTGGMAEVWRGHHPRRDEPVAVKIIGGEPAEQGDYRRQFRREVRAHAGLLHPSIVAIVGYGTLNSEQEEQPYLAMELAEEGTLRQWRVGSWSQCRAVLLQVLDALAYAHARGVIHRDLKPENVLVFGADNETPNLKLSDFGIAHAVNRVASEGSETVESPAAGTPYYMAPEQLRAAWRRFGPWTDLYALGCLAWELVCGQPPFQADSFIGISRGHLDEEPPRFTPRFPVPEGLEGWLRRALEKPIGARFQRAADAARALEALDSEAETVGEAEAHRVEETEQAARAETLTPEEAADTAIPTLAETILLSDRSADSSDRPGESTPRRQAPPAVPPAPQSDGSPVFQDPDGYRVKADTDLELLGLRQPSFVARRSERDRLWELIGRDETGVRVAMVSGASGVGKSRMVERVARRAHELGWCHVVDARPGGSMRPAEGLAATVERMLTLWGLDRAEIYQEIVAKLEQLGGPGGEETATEDARALTELVAPTEQGADVEGPEFRFVSERHRFEVVRRLLERLAARRPVLVRVEDVRREVDRARFVAYLLETGFEGKVTFVLTERSADGEVRPMVEAALRRVREAEATRCIELGWLSGSTHRKLIEKLLPLDDRLADRVCRQTDGHPLFAVQLLRDWVERDELVRQSGGFVRTEDASEIPDSVDALWQRRVRRLVGASRSDAGDTVRALELAACFGKSVVDRQWRQACREAGFEVSDRLVGRLVHRGMATRQSGRWSFIHDTLVESLRAIARRAGRLQEHHRRCAAAIASDQPDRQALTAAARAEHLLLGGLPEEALEAVLEAVEYTESQGDVAGARDLVDRGLEAVDSYGIGDESRNVARLRRWSIRFALYRRNNDRVDGQMEALRAQADRHGFVAEKGFLAKYRSIIERRAGNIDAALEQLEQARTYLGRAGEVEEMVNCRGEQGSVYLETGSYQLAADCFREARRFWRDRDIAQELTANVWLGHVYLYQHQLDSAEQLIRQTRQRARAHGLVRTERITLNQRGELARHRGNWDEAERWYRESKKLGRRIGDMSPEVMSLNITLIEVGRGNWAEARSSFRRMYRRFGFEGRKTLYGYGQLGLLLSSGVLQDWESWDELFEEWRTHFDGSMRVVQDAEWLAEQAWEALPESTPPERRSDFLDALAFLYRKLDEQERLEQVGDRRERQDES